MVDSCPKRRGVGGRGSSDQRTVATKVSLLLTPDNKRFRHLVYIGGSGVKAYIDTGREANLMALATAERLGLEIDLNGAAQLLQGFGGGQALSRWSVSFEMTLAECRMKLKLAKCSFLQVSIEYLGHEISGEGVRPGKRRIDGSRADIELHMDASKIGVSGDRLYVPAMAKFGVLRKYHDDIGHLATERCLAVLAGTYWFPKMRQFVSKYVKSCLRCAFAKGQYGRGEGLLHPIERRAIPFDTVHVDHLGPFVKSVRGNSYVLMVVGGFTKFVVAKPCKALSSSKAIARLSTVFGEFGIPRCVVTD
nr:unnamed protein product [Callosobruchus analis]